MTQEVFDELYQRTVRTYLDVLIMLELKDNALHETKTLLSTINEKYCSDISWGTLLATMASLQKNGFIDEAGGNEKPFYALSNTGKQRLDLLTSFIAHLKDFLEKVSQSAKN